MSGRGCGSYGAPRIHAELREQGVRVSRRRVAWLMREQGLEDVSRRTRPGGACSTKLG
jgi:putative transposase